VFHRPFADQKGKRRFARSAFQLRPRCCPFGGFRLS
jgi:hypothetical protein